MEFFSRFKWAVPKAFSDAVYLCRFEEGDILYDTEKAYEDDWETGSKFIGHFLQVRYPTKAKGGTTENGCGVFNSNWNSEVRIDFYKKLKKVGVDQIHTTQGRLYSALWTGNLAVLEKDSAKPPIPLSVQDVNRSLEQTSEKAKKFSVGFPVFVMVRDLSNPVSREKYFKVLSKLTMHLENKSRILTPKDAGLIDYEIIAPTIEIAFFPMKGINVEELHELVKLAVYVPAKTAKKEMFRLAAHGSIFLNDEKILNGKNHIFS